VLNIKEKQFNALATPITGPNFLPLYVQQVLKEIKQVILNDKLIGG